MAHILIVEDDDSVREMLAELLQDEGYAIAEAGNGQEALDYLRTCAVLPLLILLDLSMPFMNGWEFRAIQRDDSQLSPIPVVVLSAHRQVQEEGAKLNTVCLTKPVEIHTLLKMVRRYIDL